MSAGLAGLVFVYPLQDTQQGSLFFWPSILYVSVTFSALHSPVSSGLALSDPRSTAQFGAPLQVSFLFLSSLCSCLSRCTDSSWPPSGSVFDLSVLIGSYFCPSGRPHLQIFSYRATKHSFFGEGLYGGYTGQPIDKTKGVGGCCRYSTCAQSKASLDGEEGRLRKQLFAGKPVLWSSLTGIGKSEAHACL